MKVIQQTPVVNGVKPATSTTPTQPTTSVTAEKALSIALADAKLTANQVQLIKNKLTTDDGVRVFEVEFYHGNKEYDYTINANTGVIMEKDFDIENFTVPTTSNTTVTPTQPATLDFNRITGRKGTPKVEVDYEDGQKVYEVTYYENGVEYNYEINEQGKIIKFEIDRDND